MNHISKDFYNSMNSVGTEAVSIAFCLPYCSAVNKICFQNCFELLTHQTTYLSKLMAFEKTNTFSSMTNHVNCGKQWPMCGF